MKHVDISLCESVNILVFSVSVLSIYYFVDREEKIIYNRSKVVFQKKFASNRCTKDGRITTRKFIVYRNFSIVFN